MRSDVRSFRQAMGVLVIAGLPIFALVSACSSDGDLPKTPQQGAPAPQPPAVQGRGEEGTTQTGVAPKTGCEELGALTGTSLRAVLGDKVQSVSFPLANRPVPSRLAILAVGSAADLVGKTAALGAGANANYRSCTQCLVVALGCGTSDCAQAALFFPRSGTVMLTAAASQSGQDFDGRFEDVVLEQIKIDPATGESRPVLGGACLHIQELTFESNATQTKTDAGSTTSSSSSTSSSTSSSSSSSGGGYAADAGDGGSGGTGTSSGTGGGSGGGGYQEPPFF